MAAALAERAETGMLPLVWLLEAAEEVSEARAATAAKKAAVAAAVSLETDKVACTRMKLTSPAAAVACSLTVTRASAAAVAKAETLAPESGMGILLLALVV